MSAINLRILQDSEIENYGSAKGINELLDEVRNLMENYVVHPGANANSRTIANNSSSSNNNSNSKFQFQNNSLLKPSERLNGIPNSPKLLNPSTNTSRKPIESSFIDVQKVSIRDISILLNRRRDMHLQLIKQIHFLYDASCRSQSLKLQFLDDICTNTTCLKSLLSFIALYQPQLDSLEYNTQIESIKLISVLTENDSIKTSIKQAGDITSIVSLLQWSHKIPSYNTLSYHLITLISNLATQESCAMILRKTGAISPLFAMTLNESLHNDLRITSLNTLIIFSCYANPKISETIIDSKNSLFSIIEQIVKNSSNIANSKDSISLKFLDLLYQVSDCPKTRAIAWECGIEHLVSLIKVTEIYPIELNRGNYYKISNTQPEDPNVLIKVNFQSKVLSCLEKLCKHEHNVSKIGMSSTFTILNYIKPMFSIPFDLFRWNNQILEKILKFAIQICQDDNFKQVFIEKDTSQTMVTMILSDYFTPQVLLSCAQVLGQLVKPKKTSSSSRIFMPVDKIIGSDIIPSLMKLSKSFPHEKSLQILLCQVFKDLGTRDENKQTIFSEGGFQLLNSLLTSDDNEIVLNSLATLSVLSLNQFMRKVMRLVGSIPIIIKKIDSAGNLLIQKYSIQNLFNISLDIEGLNLLLDRFYGLLPQNLISLLYLNDSDIQIAALKTLYGLIQDELYVESFIEKDGIQSLLNSLHSNDENVQYQVLSILNRIIQMKSTQEAFIQNDIIEKLKQLSTHENVTKNHSILVQPFKALLLSVKSIPQHIIDNHIKSKSVSNGSHQIQNQSQSPNQSLPNKRYSPPQQANSNVKSIPIQSNDHPQPPVLLNNNTSPRNPPDYKKIENVLTKLNESQLRELIIDIVKQNSSVSDLLPNSIRGILTGNKQYLNTPPTSNNMISNGSLPTTHSNQVKSSNTSSPLPLPPPPMELNKMPPPPPLTSSTVSQASGVPTVSQLQQQIKKTLGDGTKPKIIPNSNKPAPTQQPNQLNKFSSLMEEIQSKVGSGNLKLKHVDTQKEIESRRKDQLMEKNNTILKDIVQNAKTRNEQNAANNKKTLIDTSVIQGMRIWKKDFELWKQEVILLFRRHEILAILVFKVLESIQDFPFKEAMDITGFQSAEKLSQILLRIGFTIKSNTFVQNSNQFTEYNFIIKPTGIPTKLLLSLIVDQMNQK